MNRAHQIEFDPTFKQRQFLVRACGVARYTWNWALAECQSTWELTGKLPNINALKKRGNGEKPEWVYASPKDANQQPFTNLKSAYSRYFKKLGKKPTFKKRGKSRDSFYLSNDKIRVEGEAGPPAVDRLDPTQGESQV